MPIYEFQNTETGETFDKLLKIAEKDEWLKDNPDIKQIFTVVPGIVSGAGHKGSIENVDNHGFKEVLQKIGEGHPMGSVADEHVRKTAKEVSTRDVIKKHAKIQLDRKGK